MHRVELKVEKPSQEKPKKEDVPNAPCGVERNLTTFMANPPY